MTQSQPNIPILKDSGNYFTENMSNFLPKINRNDTNQESTK